MVVENAPVHDVAMRDVECATLDSAGDGTRQVIRTARVTNGVITDASTMREKSDGCVITLKARDNVMLYKI